MQCSCQRKYVVPTLRLQRDRVSCRYTVMAFLRRAGIYRFGVGIEVRAELGLLGSCSDMPSSLVLKSHRRHFHNSLLDVHICFEIHREAP